MISIFSYSSVIDELQAGFRFQSGVDSNLLSNLSIKDIVQDQSGFMWFGTKDGLNRFDGNTVKIYRPSINRNSISHFYITTLLVDKKGLLWIGTSSGLNVYDPSKDYFEDFPINNIKITSLYEDSLGKIWVGTAIGGVYVISNNGNNTEFINLKDIYNDPSPIYINDTLEVKGEGVFIATQHGLFIVKDHKVSRLSNLPFNQSKPNVTNIKRLKKFDDENLLIANEKGLFNFNLTNKSLSEIQPQVLGEKNITDVFKFNKREVLVATRSSGMYLVNLSTQDIFHYENNPDEKYSLIDNQVSRIFKSKEGEIWIATNLGVNKLDITQKYFGHIKTKNNLTNCLSGNTIHATLLDSSNVLWVAAFGSGLHKINLFSGDCHKYTSTSERTSDNDNLSKIVSIFEDENKNIWFATFNQGLVRFTKNENKFELFNANLPQHNSISSNALNFVTGDLKGNLWIATFDKGFSHFDLKKNTFTNYLPFVGPNNEQVKTIKSIMVSDGFVWLASLKQGLVKFDSKNQTYTQFKRSSPYENGVPPSLTSINIDLDGNFWLGTQGYGAYIYNPSTSKVKAFTIENGLFSNMVMRIEVDSNNNKWLLTDKGLSRISSKNEEIETFFESDGLQANSFTSAGFYSEVDDVLWTGGVNGLNRIELKKISKARNKVIPVLTNFELFYKPVRLSTQKNVTPLKQAINFNKEIRLFSDQNVFSFEFASLEFKHSERVKYAFKLDGYDDWNYVDFKNRKAVYTNISPGNYVFKVKASLNRIWDDETSIKVIIIPPWWQTRFAYFIFTSVFLCLMLLIVNLRTRLLKKQSQILQLSVIERTKELENEKQKVELLLSRKNEEFANVSHELRTPLTLIQGPVTKLLAESNDSEQLKRLNIIQINALRLTRIVDQLFHIETFRIKSITDRSNQASKVIILRLVEAFQDLATEKDIELSIKKIVNVNLEFTPDALEKIILNLLSNALKYTRSGGVITVESYRIKNKELVIKITDTGVGIPEKKLGLIFERYSRVLDDNSEKVTGAGIGLALVKSLVESHNGRIELQSNLGIGTEVTVHLPIVNEVLESVNQTFINDEFIAMELMALNQQQETSLTTQDVMHLSIKKSKKPLVLLIEDNSDMRSYIIDCISSDFKVIIAGNGETGIAKAISEVPDLIISDIMMPKKDGYQVTNELRSNDITSHIPIVLLTARGDRESRLKGWYEKADEYLTKPFDAEELLIRLKNLLEIRNILKRQFCEISFKTDLKELKPQVEVCSIKAANIDKLKKFITQLNEVLEVLYVNSDTSIADIASDIAMSERQFFRKIKSVLDMTPAEYLRRFRLEKAKALLEQGNSASFTAFEVGFSSQSYFGKCFKVQFGLSPSEYKKKLQTLYPKETLIPFEDS